MNNFMKYAEELYNTKIRDENLINTRRFKKRKLVLIFKLVLVFLFVKNYFLIYDNFEK